MTSHDQNMASAADADEILDNSINPAPLKGALALIVPTLLVVTIVGPFGAFGVWPDLVTRLLAVVLGISSVIWHARKRYWTPMLQSHVSTKTTEVALCHVLSLKRQAGRQRQADLLQAAGVPRGMQEQVFTIAVTKPAEIRQRLTERFEMGHRLLKQKVSIDATIPQDLLTKARGKEGAPYGTAGPRSGDSVELLFPLLIPRKADLVDGLRVTDADGALLPTLSYLEYLQLVARALRALIATAYGRDLQDDADATAREAETTALQDIMQRGKSEKTDSSGAAMLRRLKAPNAAAIHLAARLAEKLFTHYAIVVAVQCPPSGRIVVNYERTIIPGLQLRRWQRGYRIAWCRARLRVLLGARPVDISLALENAWTSRSYHLVVDGGDGIYVGMQASPRLLPYLDSHLGAGKGSVPSVADLSFGRRGGDISDDPPTYFRFRRRLGQSYAHFYCRYLPEPPAHSTAPRIRFRFYEVPPGSTFQAMVAAAASAVLVWIIGFVISRRPELDSDAPAYLLVFPAAAAAWLGFDRPNRRLIEGTLAGRLSLLITALISLIASAFYMIDKSGLLLLNTHNPAKLRVLGIDKLSWSVLALISILSFSAIAFNYVLGLAQFIHFSTRQSYLVEHREHA